MSFILPPLSSHLKLAFNKLVARTADCDGQDASRGLHKVKDSMVITC